MLNLGAVPLSDDEQWESELKRPRVERASELYTRHTLRRKAEQRLLELMDAADHTSRRVSK